MHSERVKIYRNETYFIRICKTFVYKMFQYYKATVTYDCNIRQIMLFLIKRYESKLYR